MSDPDYSAYHELRERMKANPEQRVFEIDRTIEVPPVDVGFSPNVFDGYTLVWTGTDPPEPGMVTWSV